MKSEPMTRRSVATLAGVLVLALIIAAGGVSVQAQGDKTEVVIGYTISQTGRFSTEAAEVERGYTLWREEVNGQGGLFVKDLNKKLPLRFVVYDDKSDASTAAKLYERLITVDKVDLLLTPWGSGINFAITAVTEKHGHPAILTSASSDGIYSRGFKRIFLASELASRDAMPLADYLISMKDRIKTVAILYENFIFSETVRASFVKLIEGKGFEIVMDEKYPLGAQNFLGLLAKAKAANPDALIVFDIMPASIYVTRQMKEIGLQPKFYYVLIGPMYKEFIELGAMAEGAVEHGFWHPSLPFPGVKEFARAYEKRWGRLPTSDASHAYTATQVLTQAIARAGTLNHDKLTEVLHREEFQTVGGPYRYDEAGRNIVDKQFLAQVQNGKRVIVWPKDLAEAPLRFPIGK